MLSKCNHHTHGWKSQPKPIYIKTYEKKGHIHWEIVWKIMLLNKNIYICFYNLIFYVDTDINMQIWLVIEL